MLLTKEMIQRYDVPGPRYTSYPTAPEWSARFPQEHYLEKLHAFGNSSKTLSLYIHIPFCEQLCYFCACMKVIRQNDEKYGNEYLRRLELEIIRVAEAIGRKAEVRQLHWGGGTPTFLTEGQMARLMSLLDSHFNIDRSQEVAIEIDPRTVTLPKLRCLKEIGFNRISLGVQDFDLKVQEAVNRIQPYETVAELVKEGRTLGFASINFDLIYGLPYQTPASFHDTVEAVIGLKPDRIALYSFAYVPWLHKHQNKFGENAFPTTDQKIEIFLHAREQLLAAGYQSIAMDHFALAEDEMAEAYREGHLYRNFMGYTVKPADEYIGFGVSAIGFIENAFIQNVKTLPEYYETIDGGQLPVSRGMSLTRDDSIRQWTISSLMCRFSVDKNEFQTRFNEDFNQYFSAEEHHIAMCVQEGLLQVSDDSVKVTELGRLFVRNICMGFDWYLRQKAGHKRFSRTV